MTEHWFISDYHFYHKKLRLKYRLQWDSDDEMNEVMIQNTNELVKRNDFLYFIGDFTWRNHGIKILERLNGQIFFIYGNHDKKTIINKLKNYKNIVWHGEQKGIKIHGQKIFLNHYLMVSWNCCHWGSWHIHGHHHNPVPEEFYTGKVMNVGVDINDYKPINFGQVKDYMKTRPDNWNLIRKKYKEK